jgi:hypothetical protein
MTVKHAFTSAINDGGDATLVRPSNWNAEHSVTLVQQDRTLAADETIAAGKSVFHVGGLYIATGVTLFIGDDSIVGLV